ncbi:MAG TPA: RagB/SusD family nutrient uptake outer membrane protein, partial [Chitinophagaceae bacterium]
ETLFTSDHSSDTKYGQYTPAASGGPAQNLTPWFNRWNYPSLANINSYVSGGKLTNANAGPTMMTRDVANGRPYIRIRPNNYVWPSGANAGKNYLFDEAFSDRVNDSRYDKTFQTVWIANTANVSNTAGAANNSRGIAYSMTVGSDTAVWMPDHEVTGAPQFNGAVPFKGIIIPPSLWSNSYYPAVKKFDDLSRTGVNDPSTRPVVIFRFSDVYLIAAEAAFKTGDLNNAAAMLNVVRQRAAYRSTNNSAQNAAAVAAVTIQSSDVTLDFILDERSREFYGEWQRWWDLVRTKSLVARVTVWNPEAAQYIQPFHALRPIPQQEIDLVTEGPAFPQNPGY